MKIAILVAMDKELSLLLHQIDNAQEKVIDGHKLTTGKIGSHDVILAKCGIGKVNAAVNTYGIIKSFQPELVINSGVAGGAGNGMKIGELLIADRAAYHDVWCGPGTITGTADEAPLYFEAYRPIVDFALQNNDRVPSKVGLICSGDRFISKAEEIELIHSNFPEAMAVDMESAAIAHVCHKEGVPFNIIRVVSDTPGEGENIDQYKDFWGEAPKTTFAALKEILDTAL